MTALTEEKLNMIVGGMEIGSKDDDLPEWWRKFKVNIVIVCDMESHMTRQQIYDDVCSIWGKNSFEAQYAKKKLGL